MLGLLGCFADECLRTAEGLALLVRLLSLLWGMRSPVERRDAECSQVSPMVVIAFVAGAVVALILRTMVRAMADHSARREILRWA